MGSRYDQIDLAAVAAQWRARSQGCDTGVAGFSSDPVVGPGGLGRAVVAKTDLGELIPDPVFNGFGPRERLFAVWSAALTGPVAAATAGVSASTLRRWADCGLAPRTAWFPGRPRRWTFGDAVRCRAAVQLRSAGVPLGLVRAAFAKADWEHPVRFEVVGGDVVVIGGQGDVPATASGQLSMVVALDDVAAEALAVVAAISRPCPSVDRDGLSLVVGGSR
jgi:DNA-binding transcriptional MerR regulator